MEQAGEIALSLKRKYCQIIELVQVGLKAMEYDKNPELVTLFELVHGKMANLFQ